MAKPGRGPTFADVVREVKNAPPRASLPEARLDTTSNTFRGQGGRTFSVVKRRISNAHAARLAADGAVVAWDRCGCHGYCGLDWYDPSNVSKVERRPTIGRHGDLSEWAGDDGSVLVLATGDVDWRGLFR